MGRSSINLPVDVLQLLKAAYDDNKERWRQDGVTTFQGFITRAGYEMIKVTENEITGS